MASTIDLTEHHCTPREAAALAAAAMKDGQGDTSVSITAGDSLLCGGVTGWEVRLDNVPLSLAMRVDAIREEAARG